MCVFYFSSMITFGGKYLRRDVHKNFEISVQEMYKMHQSLLLITIINYSNYQCKIFIFYPFFYNFPYIFFEKNNKF